MFGLSLFYRYLVCFIDFWFVSVLLNWSCKYSNNYFIKLIGFISVYYAINLDIVSSYIVFSYLYLICIDLI